MSANWRLIDHRCDVLCNDGKASQAAAARSCWNCNMPKMFMDTPWAWLVYSKQSAW